VTQAILKFYHGTDSHTRDLTVPDLKIPENFPSDRIRKSRVRVARNLADYPFPTAMKKVQRIEVEKKVSKVLVDNFGGEYHSLAEIDGNPDLKEKFKKNLFHREDKYLESAGTFGDWPEGRGVYMSQDGGLVVWINKEDHLRIQTFKKGFTIKEAFGRLAEVLGVLDKHLSIASHEKHGYINSCPTNCGTGMRLSVHAQFKNLNKDVNKLKEVSSAKGLAVRPEGGESGSFGNSEWVDISNKVRLGVSESKIAEAVHNGIIDLFKIDAQ